MSEAKFNHLTRMPRVAIIILNWNGWQDTLECLQSLLCSEYQNYHIYIVDAASTNDSISRIIDWASGREDHNFIKLGLLKTECKIQPPIPITIIDTDDYRGSEACKCSSKVSLLSLENNRGYAGGNNAGLRLAQSEGPYDYYWILNNDTVIVPDTLTYLVERMEVDPNAGICGSTLLYYDSPQKVQTLGGNTYNQWFANSHYILPQADLFDPKKIDLNHIEKKIDMIHGSSMFVRHAFLKSVGLLNEEYFLFAEEIDWACRGKGKFRLVYAPESIIFHKRGRSTGNQNRPQDRSTTADYYSFRSRLIFTKNFYPWALPTVIIGMLGSVAKRLNRRQYNHAKVIIKVIWESLIPKS